MKQALVVGARGRSTECIVRKQLSAWSSSTCSSLKVSSSTILVFMHQESVVVQADTLTPITSSITVALKNSDCRTEY
jgi:hypothetical protein